MPDEAHPYARLEPTAFWRSGVAEQAPHGLDGIYRKRFSITKTDKIATAGSCFAQHISRYLRSNDFQVLDAEPAPGWLPPEQHGRYGFSIYSARYGNIYTVAQLTQLVEECAGQRTPDGFVWEDGQRFFDGLRPAIEPEGFESEAELRLHRTHHLSRVRQLLQSADVLIFTLGLTEAWLHRSSGTVFPTCPGTVAGRFDGREHVFKNFNLFEMAELFDSLLATLRTLRGGSLPRIILTVSPVPLTATASGNHVLAATTYSKAALRTLAAHLYDQYEFVDYFPSFEIATNPAARGLFFEGNLRNVTQLGVSEVMRVFFKEHLGAQTEHLSRQMETEIPDFEPSATDVQCEEVILESFARG